MSITAVNHARARHAYQFVKATLMTGLIFLVPVVILAWLVAKGAKLLHGLAQPLAALLPIKTVAGLVVVDVIAIALLILACFLGGLLARVSTASRFVKRAETGVLWRIPGYALVKGLTDSLDKTASKRSMTPVLVHFDDYSQPGFEVDRLPDGRRVVYLPSAPDPRAGSIAVVSGDRVEAMPITFIAATRLLRELGRGMGSALSPQAR